MKAAQYLLSMQACSVRATALDQPNVLKNMKNTFLEALKHVGAQADDGEVTLSNHGNFEAF